MTKLLDLTGEQFGNWTVLYRDTTYKGALAKWVCRCSCGKVKSVFACNLRHKNPLKRSTSCGCCRKRTIRHGRTGTKEYNTWRNMNERCYNTRSEKYKNWGGRGIGVFDEWRSSFEAFYDYISKLPHFGEEGRTLDRIDNEGNYEPGNLRWATVHEQNMNRRVCVGYWEKHQKEKEGEQDK